MTGDGFDQAEVAASYDAMAQQYSELFATELARNPSDRRLLEELVAALPTVGAVADVGCGPGHGAGYLARQGIEAVGIDLSPAMIERARHLHPDVAFEVGDLRELDAGGPRFVGVVAFYSLIHLRRADVPFALAGIRRALRPDGVLAATVHEGTGEVHATEWRGEAVSIGAVLFSGAQLRSTLEAADFTIEQFRRRAPYEWEYPHDKLQVLARRTADR